MEALQVTWRRPKPGEQREQIPESSPGEPSNALVKRFWGSWGLPCSASEALPGTLPRVPARVHAR
eukprot:7226439-Pyramimonas_sp.AAC.1